MRTIKTKDLHRLVVDGKAKNVPKRKRPAQKKDGKKTQQPPSGETDSKMLAEAIKELSRLVTSGVEINTANARAILRSIDRDIQVKAPPVSVEVENKIEQWAKIKFEIVRDMQGKMSEVIVEKVE